jgi:hypothetical protein
MEVTEMTEMTETEMTETELMEVKEVTEAVAEKGELMAATRRNASWWGIKGGVCYNFFYFLSNFCSKIIFDFFFLNTFLCT